MISEYRVLGIGEGADAEAIKKAYRKRVKELHPDTAETGEILKNHFLFVETCAAYRRLMERAGSAQANPAAFTHAGSGATARPQAATSAQTSPASAGTRALRPHADPAWVYYRKGADYFSSIHPGSWNPGPLITIDAKLAHDADLQRETAERVRALVRLFPQAYLCFSTVVTEYPDSPWAADSREKMRLIEERIVRYRSIIESFAEWGGYREKNDGEFHACMAENKDRYDKFNPEARDKWERER